MGAKTATNIKEKLTCDYCDGKFQTIQALKSHVTSRHTSTKPKLNDEKECKKTAFVPPTSRISKRLQQKKNIPEVTTTIDGDIFDSEDSRRTEFECPKCFRSFPVYFSAYKHIQKKHYTDGKPMDVKPVRIEFCTMCDKQINEDKHTCANVSTNTSGTYVCLGCERIFGTVVLYDMHLASTHHSDVDCMFFPNFEEFSKWKQDMESQVRVKYLTLSNTTKKQYFQCNFVSPQNSEIVTHLCPSAIIVTEMNRGFQIHYLKSHHEHKCVDYQIPEQFLQYVTNKPPEKDVFDIMVLYKDQKEDLYIKFKNLMQNIITEAAKLNVSDLRRLYDTALEIQTELLSNDEDHEYEDTDTVLRIQDDHKDEIENNDVTNKSMTDDQISKELETAPRTSARLKRKSESSATPPKKKAMKTGLKENNSITKDTNGESPKLPKLQSSSPLVQSPSFNDSYKEFIGNTLKSNDNKTETNPTPVAKKSVRKEVVKTKIGQFIPSPKKLTQIKVDENDDIKVKSKRKSIKSPRSNISFHSISLDAVEYEVVEQENDCNILVLKI